MERNLQEREMGLDTYESLLDVIANIPEINQETEKNTAEFISLVARHCNYAGLDSKTATEFICGKYELDITAVSQTVLYIYAVYADEFGSKSLMYNLKVRNKFDDEDWQKTPYIPQKVYDNLPTILQFATDKFNLRKRDMLLTGLLGVTSGMLNIKGIYNGETTYSNLFCFIIAPAASGKGVLKYAKAIAQRRQTILRESTPSIDIFIPANISTAMVYQHLHTNEGIGILFETEADTMKNTFRQDWGGYDDLMRKAFHFEEATLERKDRSIQIEHPRLSVILSGTPNQIQGIIPDVDNGLFSRFIFYICKSESEWDREIDMTGFSLDGYFGDLSIFFAIIVSNSMRAVQFSFTDRQKEIFHGRFEKWHNEFLVCYNDENVGIIKRLGNITFRIAMILTAIRFGYQRNPPATHIVYCNDIDFETAFLLAEIYKQHALFIYVTMKDKPTGNKPIDKFVLQFFEMLPPDSDFTKSDAIEIGKLINIAERTVGKYLKNLVKAVYIEQPRYGLYRKTKIKGVEYEVLNPHELGE